MATRCAGKPTKAQAGMVVRLLRPVKRHAPFATMTMVLRWMN